MSGDQAFTPDGPTPATDPLFLYFTSGTTALPKLVEHTQVSYPIGHLSTMYWLAAQPGDVHLNISSPGWAKHAWSNVFAPWNAEACVLILNAARFSARRLLDTLTRCSVTSLCAPPTVWRMVIQEDLSAWHPPLREVLSAGEPLNPEVIEQVRRAWGLTIRDGYGQTETTAQIGNTPDQPVKPGSMGRPLPGYVIDLIDPASGAHGETGEICIDLSQRPLALMVGYRDNFAHTAEVMRDGFYHTGDVASRDSDGYITYVGRADDVFKSSDYRISPFELESVLIEHPAVAEAAVVPSPIRCASRCRKRSSRWARDTSRQRTSRARSSRIRAPTLQATNAYAASSFRNCRRRSPARSAASTCAKRRRRFASSRQRRAR